MYTDAGCPQTHKVAQLCHPSVEGWGYNRFMEGGRYSAHNLTQCCMKYETKWRLTVKPNHQKTKFIASPSK